MRWGIRVSDSCFRLPLWFASQAATLKIGYWMWVWLWTFLDSGLLFILSSPQPLFSNYIFCIWTITYKLAKKKSISVRKSWWISYSSSSSSLVPHLQGFSYRDLLICMGLARGRPARLLLHICGSSYSQVVLMRLDSNTGITVHNLFYISTTISFARTHNYFHVLVGNLQTKSWSDLKQSCTFPTPCFSSLLG